MVLPRSTCSLPQHHLHRSVTKHGHLLPGPGSRSLLSSVLFLSTFQFLLNSLVAATYFRHVKCSIQPLPKELFWSPPLLRGCACSRLKVLVELTPCSVQHFEERSLCVLFLGEHNKHQIHIPTAFCTLDLSTCTWFCLLGASHVATVSYLSSQRHMAIHDPHFTNQQLTLPHHMA